MNVVCRIAPSPTGKMHLGNLYVFLYNLVYTSKFNGKLIFRVDDTDTVRNDYESSYKDFGAIFSYFSFDKILGPKQPQSDRLHRYREIANVFLQNNYAFYCCCLNYEECCCDKSKGAIFLNIQKILDEKPYFLQNDHIVVKDEIKGHIRFDIKHVKNFVLLRDNGYPTYHLACMIDDVDMNVSHIIRAEDWITSLTKHYLLLYLLNKFVKPHNILFIHLPLIRTSEGKLSKRENSLNVQTLLSNGYLPQAIENYLFNISMKVEKEIFSREYCIENFSVSNIRSTSPLFDINKLKWCNRKWIQSMSYDDMYINHYVFKNNALIFQNIDIFWKEAQNTFSTLNEILHCKDDLCQSYDFSDEVKKVISNNKTVLKDICRILVLVIEQHSDDQAININYNDLLKTTLAANNYVDSTYTMLARFILIGQQKGLSISTIIKCLSKKEKLARIQRLQDFLDIYA